MDTILKPKQYRKVYEGLFDQFRPDYIPEHWYIFNAPRPLFGSLGGTQDEPNTWTGDFISGIFYGAVDPSDKRSQTWIKENNSLDAYCLIWVTENEVRRTVRGYIAVHYPNSTIAVEDYDLIDLVGTYENATKDNGDYQ